MSKETIDIYVTQGEIRFALSMPKEVADRMGEIASRYPTGTWSERGLDLVEIAEKELKENKVLYSPELDKQSESKES